jgi:hypothetical protein
MNCKPGDIAIVVKAAAPGYLGRLLEVLYAAPSCPFVLPDGMPHAAPRSSDGWVVRSLCGPIKALCSNGTLCRMALYGVAADSCLRPLRDDPDAIDVEREMTCNI